MDDPYLAGPPARLINVLISVSLLCYFATFHDTLPPSLPPFPYASREHMREKRGGSHRGINNSAKSRFKTPSFINFRFSQDVKEVIR